MKKKLLIIGSIVVTVAIVAVLILVLCKTKYTIKVSMVDDRSPDRILTVYNSKGEKIELQRIEYLNVSGNNLKSENFGDIETEKEYRVILKDNSKVTAKIVEEGVK